MADKIIRVGCGVIIENGRLFAARRNSSSDQPMKWELPGGKLEAGESASDAVVRELREELGIETETLASSPALIGAVHRYPEKIIELIPVCVKIVSGFPEALEHHEIAWIQLDKAAGIDWADADRALLEINNMLLYSKPES